MPCTNESREMKWHPMPILLLSLSKTTTLLLSFQCYEKTFHLLDIFKQIFRFSIQIQQDGVKGVKLEKKTFSYLFNSRRRKIFLWRPQEELLMIKKCWDETTLFAKLVFTITLRMKIIHTKCFMFLRFL